MEKPRPISSGEAMRWNEDVERRRKEYHEQRCAENALYRRAYERLQEQRRLLQEQMGKSMVQLANAINSDCQQRVNSVMDNVEQQPIKTHEEVMRDCALMDSICKHPAEAMAHFTGFGLGIAVATMMFVDGKRMNQRIMELAGLVQPHIEIDTTDMPNPRYHDRTFPKHYDKKKRAKRRQQKQARRRNK